MRANFKDENPGAVFALITVSRKSLYVKFLIVLQGSEGEGEDPYSANFM